MKTKKLYTLKTTKHKYSHCLSVRRKPCISKFHVINIGHPQGLSEERSCRQVCVTLSSEGRS